MQDRIKKINERRRIIAIIPATGHEVNRIKVELFFNAGGINYATYKQEQRGYYITVQPEFYKDEGRFSSTMSKAFSGVKKLIEPASRFGKGKLAKIDIDQDMLNQLIEHVVSSNNLVITEEKKAA